MRVVWRALRRYWWNEEHPVTTENTILLTLVLVALVAAGSGLASKMTGRFATAAAMLSTKSASMK